MYRREDSAQTCAVPISLSVSPPRRKEASRSDPGSWLPAFVFVPVAERDEG